MRQDVHKGGQHVRRRDACFLGVLSDLETIVWCNAMRKVVYAGAIGHGGMSPEGKNVRCEQLRCSFRVLEPCWSSGFREGSADMVGSVDLDYSLLEV